MIITFTLEKFSSRSVFIFSLIEISLRPRRNIINYDKQLTAGETILRKIRLVFRTFDLKREKVRFTCMARAQNTVHSVWTGAYTAKESRLRTGGRRKEEETICLGMPKAGQSLVNRRYHPSDPLSPIAAYLTRIFSFVKAILIAATNSA